MFELFLSHSQMERSQCTSGIILASIFILQTQPRKFLWHHQQTSSVTILGALFHKLECIVYLTVIWLLQMAWRTVQPEKQKTPLLLLRFEVRWNGCSTSESTIFQSYVWRHIDVQTDWRRSWTYGRPRNAIGISYGPLTCPSKHRHGASLLIGYPRNRPI